MQAPSGTAAISVHCASKKSWRTTTPSHEETGKPRRDTSSFPEKGSAEHLSKIGLLLSAVKSQHVFAGRRASYVGLRLGRRGAGCLAHWLVYHVRACKILNPSDKTCAPG